MSDGRAPKRPCNLRKSAIIGELTCPDGPSILGVSPRSFCRGRSLKIDVGECGTLVAPLDRCALRCVPGGDHILSFCDSDDQVVRSMSYSNFWRV